MKQMIFVAEKMGIKGFTAQFSECPFMIPTRGSVLIFNKTLSNIDNCYNPATGVFTAPKTGIYSFYLRYIACQLERE